MRSIISRTVLTSEHRDFVLRGSITHLFRPALPPIEFRSQKFSPPRFSGQLPACFGWHNTCRIVEHTEIAFL